MEGVLRPGEVLFYPEDTWHQTEVVGAPSNTNDEEWSVSLTGTLVTPHNFRLVEEELRQECGVGNAKRIPLSAALCAALPRCFAAWEDMWGGGGRGGEGRRDEL